MSHLPEHLNLYTSHEEHNVQNENCLTEICVYTLKDGGYLYVKTVHELVEKDDWKDRKLKETTCFASMDKPECCSDAEHKEKTIDVLTKLFELSKTK